MINTGYEIARRLVIDHAPLFLLPLHIAMISRNRSIHE